MGWRIFMKTKVRLSISIAICLLVVLTTFLTGCLNGSEGYKWKTFAEYSADLRESGAFEGTASAENIEEFAYIDYDFNSDVLVQIRNQYGTMARAGTGTTLDKTINLLAWVADKITHDGGAGVDFEDLNGLTLLDHSYGKLDKGINCGLLAIVLNDCLKSVGIKSKRCYLMPIIGNSGDSHVANMVYIDNLDKWILVDPSWNSYFQDEAGIYLDAFELREAFANNESVTVNKNAHWNHNEYDSGQDASYKQYMSKNLYFFRTYNNSEHQIDFIPNNFDHKTWLLEFHKHWLDNAWFTQKEYDTEIDKLDKNDPISYSKDVFLKVD